VTGRPPFQGTYAEVRTGVLESTPPAPSSINPEIPTRLDEVVRTAMAKQKLTRYETATQVARELERGGGA
jgi:serine/threonine-protein kinase